MTDEIMAQLGALERDVREHLDGHHGESVAWDQAHRQGVNLSLQFLVNLAAEQTKRSAQTAIHAAATEADKRAAEADRQLFNQLSHLLHTITAQD